MKRKRKNNTQVRTWKRKKKDMNKNTSYKAKWRKKTLMQLIRLKTTNI